MPSGSIKTWGQLFLTWPCLPKQVTQPLWVSVNWSAGHYVELIVSMWLLSRFSRVRLCDPMGCSPPGSSVPGILQARITGVGCQSLLLEIFPIQGSNPCLLRLLHGKFFTTWEAPDSHVVVRNNTGRSLVYLPQFPPLATFCKTVVSQPGHCIDSRP